MLITGIRADLASWEVAGGSNLIVCAFEYLYVRGAMA
jgi:hypothetical protein